MEFTNKQLKKLRSDVRSKISSAQNPEFDLFEVDISLRYMSRQELESVLPELYKTPGDDIEKIKKIRTTRIELTKPRIARVSGLLSQTGCRFDANKVDELYPNIVVILSGKEILSLVENDADDDIDFIQIHRLFDVGC